MNHFPVITITWPHWSWKDTLISSWLNQIANSSKVVSTTNRLPRKGEIEWYTYNYSDDIPHKDEIFDWISLPLLNSRNWKIWIQYWITKSHVASLYQDEKIHLWHSAPTVIYKLREQFREQTISVLLQTDEKLLIQRLIERDGISEEKAYQRLLNDPGSLKSPINPGLTEKSFDAIIDTSNSKADVLRQFLEVIKFKS